MPVSTRRSRRPLLSAEQLAEEAAGLFLRGLRLRRRPAGGLWRRRARRLCWCRLALRRRFALLAVLPVVDEVIDNARVGEGGGVAQIAVLVFRDLAQDAPHDLARARLRQ